MGLEIVWMPDADPDFADPVESHQPGGWRFFDEELGGVGLGQGGASIASRWRNPTQTGSAHGVRLKGFTLLTRESVFDGRIETAALADYVRALLAAVKSRTERPRASAGHDLALECELRPDGTRGFRMFVRPADDADAFGDLEEYLQPVEPPPVAFGPVRFQLNVLVGGGRPVGP